MLACVLAALHNGLALAPAVNGEGHKGAAQALVRDGYRVCLCVRIHLINTRISLPSCLPFLMLPTHPPLPPIHPRQVAARALLCKLMRIALPPHSTPEPDTTQQEPQAQPQAEDPVLEWTYLLLLRLLRAGEGAGVWEACAVRLPAEGDDDDDDDEVLLPPPPPVVFTPEQLVLLHFLEQALGDRHAHAHAHSSSSGDDTSSSSSSEGVVHHVLLAPDGGALCEALAVRVVRASRWLDRDRGREERERANGGNKALTADTALLAAGAAAAVRVLGGALMGMEGGEEGEKRKEALVSLGLVGAFLRLLRREGGAADGSIPTVRRFFLNELLENQKQKLCVCLTILI